jgi:hypothetical protein
LEDIILAFTVQPISIDQNMAFQCFAPLLIFLFKFLPE